MHSSNGPVRGSVGGIFQTQFVVINAARLRLTQSIIACHTFSPVSFEKSLTNVASQENHTKKSGHEHNHKQ